MSKPTQAIAANAEPLPRVNLPAALNFQPEVLTNLTALGLSVVIVYFNGIKQGHPALNRGNLAEKLGRDLQAVHAGVYDSTAWLPEQHWHFYHTPDLGKAIETLKAGLQRRGVLKYAKIFAVESPTELMTWWPPTAEKITYKPT